MLAHTGVVVNKPGSAAITQREREVLTLVAEHLTNAEIAADLCLSVRTVESHVSSMMRKTQVSDRRALARQARDVLDPWSSGPGRWPARTTSFVGRTEECAALWAAVAEHRMVTVTGPGGVGKTRLAVQVAQKASESRRDGGWFVDLAPVTEPGTVCSAIGSTLGVPEGHHGSIDDAVVAALASSDAVVVLDNCEHVLDDVRTCVEKLMAGCPSLTVVATSRVRLMTPFEWVFVVVGLSVTEQGGDAVDLFEERARAAGSQTLDRPQVASLCRAFDGVALAIELAAARSPSLGLDGLARGRGGFDSLTTGALSGDRHRSMRDTIAWSFDLLTSREQAMLCAVSVFASWFDVDAASVVAEDGSRQSAVAHDLGRLTEHNLLVALPGEPTRYRALELIRQFAAEELTVRGASDAVRRRHHRLVPGPAVLLADQKQNAGWCDRFDRLVPDVRAAITWGAHSDGRTSPDLAELLAAQLLLRGRPGESQRGYVQAAQLSQEPATRARLLALAAGAAASRLVGNDALRLLERAAAETVAAGDPSTGAEHLAWMAVFYSWAPGIIAELPVPALRDSWLARARSLQSDSPAAEATILLATAQGLPDNEARTADVARRARTLAHQSQRPLVESAALDTLCGYHLANGRLAEALREISHRGDVMRDVPLTAESAYHFNDYLLMATEVRLAAGHLRAAAAEADRLGELGCYRDYPHPALARRLKVDVFAGDLDIALARGEQFLRAWERAGRPVASTLSVSAYAMALAHGLLRDEPRRRRWVELTRTLTIDPERMDSCITGWAPTFDGLLALDRGDPDGALTRMDADIDDTEVWGGWGSAMWRAWYAALWTEAAVLAKHPRAEERLRRAGPATQENPVAATIVARAGDLARGDHEAVGTYAATFAALGCDYQSRRSELLAQA